MEIANDIWTIIETEIKKIHHGTVTLIVQDGRLIQLDKAEKIRLYQGDLVPKATGGIAAKKRSLQNLHPQVTAALNGLRFGQVVVVLKDNSVVQIERVEKHRVNDLTGFGDGI